MAQAIRSFARNGPRKRGRILFVLCEGLLRRVRLLEPPVSPWIEDGPPVGISVLVSQVLLVPVPVALVGALEAAVRKPDEGLFHGPHVARGKPPVRPQGTQVEDAIPVDAPGPIHVGVHVGEDQVAHGTEEGLSAMESRIARTSNGSELG